MAGQKFIQLVNGELAENTATQSSAGVGDAGKIPALGSDGRLDTTMMPVGIGAETILVNASEALSAGDFVNIYNATGKKCRKADNSNGRRAHGFVLSSVSSGADATVYLDGNNTAVSAKTPGAIQFLGTAGSSTETPPSGTGIISQQIGEAVDTSVIKFEAQYAITLA